MLPVSIYSSIASSEHIAALSKLELPGEKKVALSAALEAGNPKCVNTVMLGVLAASTEVEKAHWLEAVRALVPAKTVDINLAAFEKGFAAGCSKQI